MPNVDVEIRAATTPHSDLDTETIAVDADTARRVAPQGGANGGVVVDGSTGEYNAVCGYTIYWFVCSCDQGRASHTWCWLRL